MLRGEVHATGNLMQMSFSGIKKLLAGECMLWSDSIAIVVSFPLGLSEDRDVLMGTTNPHTVSAITANVTGQ